MYLKALEIQGFKSFPDRTRLTFEKDITAIVGPNGSGKSNVADAISWVLGEQRTKTLRGSKMEDVIFGGTELRRPLGYAEVSLILDNHDKIVDSDCSEVQITRKYYRSGESEYFINREQVRLKDLNNLLMDTGLGRDGYSVIGQGRIAEIVSSRSSDRREVFDEAAGISRYRARKDEAEKRLEKTEENLLRVNDKIEELEYQVEPLRRQSENAKQYLTARDELRQKEVSAWMETLDKLREKSVAIEQEYEQSRSELDREKNHLDALYASSDSLTERMHLKDEEVDAARVRLGAKEGQGAECSAAIEVLRANETSTRESKQRLMDDIREQESRTGEIRGSIGENQARIREIDALKVQGQEQLRTQDNIAAGLKMKIQSREQTLENLTEETNRISAERRYTESRLKMLQDMERSYEGFPKVIRQIMAESDRGALQGIYGPVASLVRAKDMYALAIETALGIAAQNIITDTQSHARQAIEWLKRTDSGRATFLPLNAISAETLGRLPKNVDGFVDLACNLVECDSTFRPAVVHLLGKTIVAEDLASATEISSAMNGHVRVVTLDGQVVNAGGSMTGGSAARGTGFLSRANEQETLAKKLFELTGKEKKCTSDAQSVRNELSGLRYQADQAMEDRSAVAAELSSLDAERSAVEKTITQFEALLDAITDNSGARKAAMEKADEEIARILSAIGEKQEHLKKLGDEAEQIRQEISAISNEKLELEGRRSRNDSETKELFDKITDLERNAAKIEQKKISAALEEKQILDKLWDTYELSHSAAQQIRQEVESLTKLNREIAELKKKISALGTPNLGAIEEYKRVSERYTFLTEQRNDITTAKKELEGVIREVTEEMKEVFLEQFRIINEQFRQTFTELFGGGKAELRLENPEDVLGCGIEIHVQPPGKAVSSISLLSGGEMAFVAIALYFAILKVRPTPFVIMDEIEAALDEANVIRFASYMRKMSDKTQFITITHRRGTMEEADFLYGITMQEKGVSSVLELDLEQAKNQAEG